MKIKLNRIIKYLILSDLVFYSGWGLTAPIFAIYILNSIQGGNAFVVGMAAGLHLVVRSVFRLLFGIYVDSHKGLKDDYFCLVSGLFISSLVPFGYLYASMPWHIYVLQTILGIGLALTTSGFTSIFTRNLDKGKESTEWGIDGTAVGIGPGITGVLGGLGATYLGFDVMFILSALVGMIGVILLMLIHDDVLKVKLQRIKVSAKSFRQKRNHYH